MPKKDLTGQGSFEIEDKRIAPEMTPLSDWAVIPPFSSVTTYGGEWRKRKNQWLALGIQSELGRGVELTYTGKEITSEGLDYYRHKEKARKLSPGGSPMPAMNYKDGKRGDGRGRPLAQSYNCGAPGELNKKLKAIPGGGCGKNSAHKFKTEKGMISNKEAGGLVAENTGTGTSIFDPVLCELAYCWFSPPGGLVIDPYAGGSVRGIVAAKLGRSYLGVDLRPEQVAANREQAVRLCDEDYMPAWITGDARDIKEIGSGLNADLIFSCPPYYDLEVYSETPGDLSALGSYEDFIKVYRQIIKDSLSLLKPNRFACFVVGDIRDRKTGFYRNFVGDTVQAFLDAGTHLYNEIILNTAIGSAPVRAKQQFGVWRKVVKTHQNVLVFYKGNPKAIKTEFPNLSAALG